MQALDWGGAIGSDDIMNLSIALVLAWIFSWAEDVWFNRLLTYQLQGEAGRKKRDPTKAIELFSSTVNSYSWTTLAVGLTLVVLSFPNQFEFGLWGLSFATGVLVCVWYIAGKLRGYGRASRLLRA